MGPKWSKTPRAVNLPRPASFYLQNKRGTRPRIIVSNESPYRVSYWVLQEDKKRTTAHMQRTKSFIGVRLKAGCLGWSTSADANRKNDVAVETEETWQYLMIDHRMEPKGLSQDTEVPFPVGCQELRVYACFEEDGKWYCFKNKVYSIAQQNRSVHLTALLSNITPYRRDQGKSVVSMCSLRCVSCCVLRVVCCVLCVACCVLRVAC